MRQIESKVRTGIAGTVKHPSKVRRSVPLASHRGNPARPYQPRVGNANNVVPLPYTSKVSRSRVPIIKQGVAPRKVRHNKASTVEPARWNEKRIPDQTKTYPLYRDGKLMGDCTVLEVRVARISKATQMRYKVALNGKAVGWAAQVGSHMRYINRV